MAARMAVVTSASIGIGLGIMKAVRGRAVVATRER